MAGSTVTSERISFPGTNGELSGTLEQPANGALRGVAIFAHCFACGRNALAASRIARHFAAHGIATLRFDFAGIGESEGAFERTGLVSNADDIVAATEALAERGLTATVLVGHSYGGAAAIAAAHRLPSLTHVVTVGAPHDVAHVIDSIGVSRTELEKNGSADFTLFGRKLAIGRQFVEQASNAAQHERLAGLSQSLLVLHSPEDEIVPFSEGERIFAEAGGNKSFVSLEGIDHLASSAGAVDRISSVIAAWLRLPESEAAGAAQGIRPLPGTVRVRTGTGKFAQVVQSETHDWIADEPLELGGDDRGPTPYDHLLAALGTCTSMTISLYAARKGIPLDAVETELEHGREHAADCIDCDDGDARIDVIDRSIRLHGELTAEQREKLMEIADRCPVHRTLENRIEIKTIAF